MASKFVFSRFLLVGKIALIIVALIIFCRLFLFDIFKIPSGSMNNSLHVNDLIIINKLKYSNSVVPLLDQYFFSMKTDPCERNDVFVFKHSKLDKEYFVKRCLGIPGDLVQAVNNEIVVNKSRSTNINTVRYRYRIKYRHYGTLVNDLQSEKIDRFKNGFEKVSNGILLFLDEEQKGRFSLKKNTISIERESKEQGDFIPFVVPYKGYKVVLSPGIMDNYAELIRKYEHCQINKGTDAYLINGIKTQYYVFKQNYYYMVGDNRDDSVDSRIYGPIPETNIIGKLLFVLN